MSGVWQHPIHISDRGIAVGDERQRVMVRGGGSLDGHVVDVPAATGSLRLHGSHYVIEDEDSIVATFVGHGETGAEMARISRQQRDRTAAEREAALTASQAQGCRQCGNTYGSLAAYQVHRDPGWPGGCLPDDACGQLVRVDGVWLTPTDAAAR